MKNIFDFATKELSQDAFLRWLFENYNCENENVKKVCMDLLNRFAHISAKASEISELKTYAQRNKIDVTVKFSYNSQEHIIVIEDKIFSGIGEKQLSNYKEKIKADSEFSKIGNRHFVFYKTDFENSTDRKTCEEEGWEYYFIDKIFNIFEQYSRAATGSQILDQYIEHICHLYSKMSHVSLIPMSDWRGKWDILDFKVYLYYEIFPNLHFEGTKIKKYWSGWPGSYYSLMLEYPMKGDVSIYMEIQARPYAERFIALLGIHEGKNEANLNIGFIKKTVGDLVQKQNPALHTRNYKHCIASTTAESLSYANGNQANKRELLDILTAFRKICEDLEKNNM